MIQPPVHPSPAPVAPVHTLSTPRISKLKHAAIEAHANLLWSGNGTLSIAPDGQHCRVTHQQSGKFVTLELTREHLGLAIEPFAQQKLGPALAQLRAEMGLKPIASDKVLQAELTGTGTWKA